jgi:GT2 family glycosyltransferase
VPRVSVIVPIFNGMAFLPAFFDSLAAALPDDSELILVDDGSDEPVWNTVPDFARAGSIVRLKNERNVGYSATVNRGFAAATGEIVVQLNTDLVLDPACVEAMIEVIARERRVGIVGSKLVFPTTGLIQHIGMAFGNFTKPHIYAELPATHPLCRVTREVQIMTGATVAMTRRVLDRLGPLDTQYFNVNEDIEHCLLAIRQGLRNFVSADSVAYHWKSRSGPARFARMDAGEAMFWSRWGATRDVDLARFVSEALEHVLGQAPRLADIPFQILDLSRGADRDIVSSCLERHWRGIETRIRHFRQTNNLGGGLQLPLVLPHWIANDPTPFVYLVDRYRELEENELWFESRRQIVEDELIVDLTGAALPTSELGPAR